MKKIPLFTKEKKKTKNTTNQKTQTPPLQRIGLGNERNICLSFTNFLVILLFTYWLREWNRKTCILLLETSVNHSLHSEENLFMFSNTERIRAPDFFFFFSYNKGLLTSFSKDKGYTHTSGSVTQQNLPEKPAKYVVPCWAPWDYGYIPNLKLAQMHLYELQSCVTVQPYPKIHTELFGNCKSNSC